MLWWDGSREIANVVMLAVCSSVVGACWLASMHFIFQGTFHGACLRPRDGPTVPPRVAVQAFPG